MKNLSKKTTRRLKIAWWFSANLLPGGWIIAITIRLFSREIEIRTKKKNNIILHRKAK